jgi:septal ring factor EnvC (AmiA/AmiB activator)
MLDKQINILKNKPYLTPSQKASLDKLSKIKKEREDCQKDLAEKKKRIRSDDRKLTANKREIEQSGKQNRFNEECQHKRKQDAFNRDAEHKRKQEEMNQRKERERLERADNERKQQEMNRRKEEERQRRPSPEPSPPPSQSDCVDGVRVNSPSWTRLNQTQKNEMLRRKASFDAWNRDHPGQLKSYPSQMLEMFCQ